MDLLYSRYEHGAKPVLVRGDGVFGLIEGDGVEREFHTQRDLLRAVTGREGWSWSRYFRVSESGGGVLDLFPPLVSGGGQLVPLAPSVSQVVVKACPAVSVPSVRRGIDLGKRAGEVRRLLYAGFGRWMVASGYDPEDVLQEVYAKILRANEGSAPWDPSRSSFGHYVHLVCSSALKNYHRKAARRQFEQVGVRELGEDKDVGEACRAGALCDDAATQRVLFLEAADDLAAYIMREGDLVAGVAVKVLPLLAQGHSRAEIGAELGISTGSLSRAISRIRASAREWERAGS